MRECRIKIHLPRSGTQRNTLQVQKERDGEKKGDKNELSIDRFQCTREGFVEGPDQNQEKTFEKERNSVVEGVHGGWWVHLTVVRKVARVNLFCTEKCFFLPPRYFFLYTFFLHRIWVNPDLTELFPPKVWNGFCAAAFQLFGKTSHFCKPCYFCTVVAFLMLLVAQQLFFHSLYVCSIIFFVPFSTIFMVMHA